MTTIDEFQVSSVVRLANAIGRPFSGAIDLDADSLRKAAERETGLSDWGDEDFFPGFEALVSAFADDTTQTVIGRLSMRIELLRRLKNRLLLEQSLQQNPDILARPVSRPLFIVGFPRTGTTLLHKLLSQDPDAHVPLYWKLHTPLPLTGGQAEIDRRIRSASGIMRATAMIAPKWVVIHPTGVHEPEECVFLLSDNLTYGVRAHIPKYIEQYLAADLTPVYRNYQQHLQGLQWRQPQSYWALKSPLHLWSLDALLAVFPDACIIQTHRDPVKAFPSWCSLVTALGIMARKRVEPEQIGAEWLSLWKIGIERSQKARESADPARFFDAQYTDLVADPLAMVRRIYAHFGIELTPEAETRMQQWLEVHAHGAHEHHRYDIEQYGLSNEVISREFRAYRENFGIRSEWTQ
jgi:hypothetical protein